jgi:DNA mismatch endonuclease (patch repair protein)
MNVETSCSWKASLERIDDEADERVAHVDRLVPSRVTPFHGRKWNRWRGARGQLASRILRAGKRLAPMVAFLGLAPVSGSVKSELSNNRLSQIVRGPYFSGLAATSPATSSVKSRTGKRDTAPERLLRRYLWDLGLRYRIDVGNLAARPDIVFASARVAVFCDGDFWHGRNWRARRRGLLSGTNSGYWIAKIRSNITRDRLRTTALEAEGWTVIRLWESDIRADPDAAAALVRRVVMRRSAQRRRIYRLSLARVVADSSHSDTAR